MTAELAFQNVENGTSQCTDLLSTESPMGVELAFRHANNGTSQCQFTS